MTAVLDYGGLPLTAGAVVDAVLAAAPAPAPAPAPPHTAEAHA
jgi:hypothetical protein